jgi:hypothetical protein
MGTPEGDEIDAIIAGTVAHELFAAEHERRRQWTRIVENAVNFRPEYPIESRSSRPIFRTSRRGQAVV